MIEESDFLVIGSGVAGLMFAAQVASHGSVTILCKNLPSEGNTQYAQGGIASVTSPLDSFQSHIQDTIEAGAGLCNPDAVKGVVTEGPSRIEDLINFGARFDKHEDGEDYSLGQEGGHSARRILHARDATGAEIQRAVFEKVSSHPNVKIYPFNIAIDLIVETKTTGNEVLGAYVFDLKTKSVKTLVSKVTMLATGGAGKVYLYTSNPDVATADGIAMAYRGGARISNMEFIQFHPTCLYHPEVRSFLITEAMRGEGAILRTIAGKEFMEEYDPRKELAPRDIVARAIDDQMKKTGDDCVLLDISHRDQDFIKNRFPTIYNKTLELGFDITKQAIPVVPAAHYSCGGVTVDKNGQTDLKRMYCSGEAACTGLHGANRLASNSLLEALVYSHRAAAHCLENLNNFSQPTNVKTWDHLDTTQSSEEVIVSHAWDEVRRTMWNLVGIVRSDKRLDLAKKRLANIKSEVADYYWSYRVTPDLIELRNIIDIAQIIVISARARRESRGLHFNVDCPETKADLACDTIVTIDFDNNEPRLISASC